MTSHRLKTAKKYLREAGWSQQAAAKYLGVTFEHLNRVLNGHRESLSLIEKIEKLPVKEVSRA